jgi:hypothetical protein
MPPFKYRFLLWQFIGAMDTGKYDSVTFEEVYRHAEAGTIRGFLNDRLGSDLELSMVEPQEWIVISETWADIANAVNARRKFGVGNKGLCLLMAYTLESLQRAERVD